MRQFLFERVQFQSKQMIKTRHSGLLSFEFLLLARVPHLLERFGVYEHQVEPVSILLRKLGECVRFRDFVETRPRHFVDPSGPVILQDKEINVERWACMPVRCHSIAADYQKSQFRRPIG
jgi:hypothetical protein